MLRSSQNDVRCKQYTMECIIIVVLFDETMFLMQKAGFQSTELPQLYATQDYRFRKKYMLQIQNFLIFLPTT